MSTTESSHSTSLTTPYSTAPMVASRTSSINAESVFYSTSISTAETLSTTGPPTIHSTSPIASPKPSLTSPIDSTHISIAPSTFSTSTSSPAAAPVVSSSQLAPIPKTSPTGEPDNPLTDSLHGNKVAHILAIVLPVILAIAFLVLTILLAWRHVHRKSFGKHMSWCPGFATLHRWSETRSRNRSVRSMRATYTGDNNGFMGDTYTSHRRKYQEDVAKAKPKQSFEALSSPLPRNRGHLGFSSPLSQTSTVHPTDIPGAWKFQTRQSGMQSSSDTESIESWQQKWYDFGQEKHPASAGSSPSKYSDTQEPKLQADRSVWK